MLRGAVRRSLLCNSKFYSSRGRVTTVISKLPHKDEEENNNSNFNKTTYEIAQTRRTVKDVQDNINQELARLAPEKQTHELVTPEAAKYMRTVYAQTGKFVSVSALSSAFAVATAAGPGIAVVAGLGAVGAMIGACITTDPKAQRALIYASVMGIGFSAGPLMADTLAVNPMLIPIALAGTASITATMSFLALYARSTTFLKYGGPSMALGWTLFGLGIGSYFVPWSVGSIMYDAWLYGFLGLGAYWVGHDTQMILKDFHKGQKDVLMHSVNMFLNMQIIFERLLMIMKR